MILDHFLSQPENFRPTSIEQYTAFQIARYFNGSSRLKPYVLAADSFTAAELIRIFLMIRSRNGDEARFFATLNH
jgi:hypothetical protein